jgi:hypothetical protein
MTAVELAQGLITGDHYGQIVCLVNALLTQRRFSSFAQGPGLCSRLVAIVDSYDYTMGAHTPTT